MTGRSFLPPQDHYDSDFTDRLIFGEKLCPTCQAKKPRNSEHFGKDVTNGGGLHRECMECRNAAQRGNRTSHADYERHRYQTDPEYRERMKASARRAKQKRRAAI